jgi:predicted ATPase
MHALAEQSGLLASQARANMYCGWAEAMSSSAQAGAQRFDEGLMLHQQVGTDDNYSIHSDMQAEILQRMGRSAEALLLIDQAIKRGSKSGQWFWLPELFRRRAELRHYLGEPRTRVESDLWRAVQTADLQGAGWLLERAQRDLQRHSK